MAVEIRLHRKAMNAGLLQRRQQRSLRVSHRLRQRREVLRIVTTVLVNVYVAWLCGGITGDTVE